MAEESQKSKLNNFLIIQFSFPSIALFQQRLSWQENGIRIGYKISELLPRPFLNKLKNIYNSFLEKLNAISLIISAGELRQRVLPYDKLPEFERLYREFHEKLELLRDNIISFIDSAKVDPEFLWAYQDRSVEEDFRNFWRKIDIITSDIEDPEERKSIKDEIVEVIKKKAYELPERFKYLLLPVSFDLSVILSNLKYKTRKEIQEKATKTLTEIFERSKKEIEESFKEQLANALKELIEGLKKLPDEVIDLAIYKLKRYDYFDIVKEKIEELRNLKGQATLDVVIETILDLKQTIMQNKEELLKAEAKNLLEMERKKLRRIIKKLEDVEKIIDGVTDSIRRELSKAIVKLETISGVVTDEELDYAIDRLKKLDLRAIEVLAKKTEDTELQEIVKYVLAKKELQLASVQV